MKQFWFVLVLLALVGVPVSPFAGDSVDFTYHFDKGYEQAFKISFNQDIDAGFFTFNRFADLKVVEKCTGADSNGFHMEMLFVEVEASKRFGENMSEDEYGKNLAGKSVTYLVTTDGSVDDVQPMGYVEGWEKMAQVVTPVIESGYVYLPGKAVSPGESWKREGYEDKTDSGLKTVTDAEFDFKGMKEEKGRNCAKIEGKSRTKMEGKLEFPAGFADAAGSGSGKYEFLFDPAASMIIKMKNKVEATLEIIDDSGESNETVFSYSIERQIQ